MASLFSLLETALVAQFSDLVSGDCYPGTSYGDKVLPNITCVVSRAAQPFKSATGGGPANYVVECGIIVRDTAKEGSTFDDLADAVHSRTATDGFAAGLSAGALNVFGETEPAVITREVDGDSWVQTITLVMEVSLTSTAD